MDFGLEVSQDLMVGSCILGLAQGQSVVCLEASAARSLEQELPIPGT